MPPGAVSVPVRITRLRGARELPLPARMVIDTGGVVRSIEANPDYTRRPEPEATLEVLRSLG